MIASLFPGPEDVLQGGRLQRLPLSAFLLSGEDLSVGATGRLNDFLDRLLHGRLGCGLGCGLRGLLDGLACGLAHLLRDAFRGRGGFAACLLSHAFEDPSRSGGADACCRQPVASCFADFGHRVQACILEFLGGSCANAGEVCQILAAALSCHGRFTTRRMNSAVEELV